jgi:hypothetical protein
MLKLVRDRFLGVTSLSNLPARFVSRMFVSLFLRFSISRPSTRSNMKALTMEPRPRKIWSTSQILWSVCCVLADAGLQGVVGQEGNDVSGEESPKGTGSLAPKPHKPRGSNPFSRGDLDHTSIEAVPHLAGETKQ